MDNQDVVSSAVGRRVLGFLYPPFELGIDIPLDLPCSLVLSLTAVGVSLAPLSSSSPPETDDSTTTATVTPAAQIPTMVPKGLESTALLDDAKAVAVDASARRNVARLLGPNGPSLAGAFVNLIMVLVALPRIMDHDLL